MFGKKKKIAELTEQNSQLSSRLDELTKQSEALKQELEAYKTKELMISRAMTEAAVAAERIKSDAEQYAGEVRQAGLSEAQQCEAAADCRINEAQTKAGEIISAAEDESRRRIQSADVMIRDYASIVKQYNETVKESVLQAERNARQYAEFYRKITEQLPDLLTGDAREGVEFTQEAVEEPLVTVDELAQEQQQDAVFDTADIIDALADDESSKSERQINDGQQSEPFYKVETNVID